METTKMMKDIKDLNTEKKDLNTDLAKKLFRFFPNNNKTTAQF